MRVRIANPSDGSTLVVTVTGEVVILKFVIAAPPVLAGASQKMVALESPATASNSWGAEGTTAVVVNVTDPAGPDPTVFFATTVAVYCVPAVKPVTPSDVVTPRLAVEPLTVTSYPVIAEPPLELGADQLIVAVVVVMLDAVTVCGTVGTTAGTVGLALAVEPVPTEFTAAIVRLYVVPGV